MHQIIGHDHIARQIAKSFMIGGRWHHAWLLYGEYSCGKGLLVRALGAWLLGKGYKQESFDINKIDSNIYDRLCNNSHPDGLILESGSDHFKLNKKQKIIAVDEIREAIKYVMRPPIESEVNVVIIDAAEEMNINAANAILKVLEEPPLHTVIFLVSHLISNVLPTVRSRCVKIAVPALKYKDFYHVIESQSKAIRKKDLFFDIESDEEMKKLYQFSNGSIAQALFIKNHDYKALYRLTEGEINRELIEEIVNFAVKYKADWHINSLLIFKALYYMLRKFPDNIFLIEHLHTFNKVLYNINILHVDLEFMLRDFFRYFPDIDL